MITPYMLTGNGQIYNSSTQPIYDPAFRFWRCADANGNAFNVSDLTGATFYVSGTQYPTLTPIAYYNAFSISEAVAIKNSTDSAVQEFWYRLEMLITNASTATDEIIDPNSVQVTAPLDYLSVTDIQPATATPATYIQPARIPQIQAGIPQ